MNTIVHIGHYQLNNLRLASSTVYGYPWTNSSSTRHTQFFFLLFPSSSSHSICVYKSVYVYVSVYLNFFGRFAWADSIQFHLPFFSPHPSVRTDIQSREYDTFSLSANDDDDDDDDNNDMGCMYICVYIFMYKSSRYRYIHMLKW